MSIIANQAAALALTEYAERMGLPVPFDVHVTAYSVTLMVRNAEDANAWLLAARKSGRPLQLLNGEHDGTRVRVELKSLGVPVRVVGYVHDTAAVS